MTTRILFVEDHEDSRLIFKKTMTPAGYQVELAANGREALELARQKPPDLVISDILMPELDGFGLCRAMKTDPALRHIPFVFYSATYTDPEDERLARDLGASRFILKPMETEPFLAVIREVLEDHRQGRLPVPEKPQKADDELVARHAGRVTRKLDQKMQELERSETRYRRLVEALREDYFFYCHDTDGIFTYLSPSIETVLGYSAEEFLVHYAEYYTDNPVNLQAREHTEKSMQGLQQPPYELEIFHKNGTIRYLAVTETPVWDDSGRVTAVEGIAHDITARKELERQLRQAKTEWERTFDSIGVLITIQDPEQRVVRANQAACEALGLEPDEVRGRTCHELFCNRPTPCPNCPAHKSRSDLAPHSAEIDYQSPRGTFLVSCSPIVDDKGRLQGIVHIAKDVSDQKKLESQLRQAQKMEAIGTLAGGIAHDFNNILTPVLGYADLVLDMLPANSKLRSYQEQVVLAGQRAKELVRQILTLSRRTEKELRPLLVAPIVKEVLKLLRSSLPSTIDIQQDISPDCGPVLADPTQIHQIVMNLCTNAFHAMEDAGGVLTVTLHEEQSTECLVADEPRRSAPACLHLTVRDTGRGMEPELVERVFEPYFTTKAKGEGTGLGLSMVHGIVKTLEGEITVESEPGQGTAFHIYLPLALGDPKTSADSPEKPVVGGSEIIWLVDDEPQIVEMGQRLLETLGYRVRTFTDSRALLAEFRETASPPDLLLTDLTMPHLPGLALIDQVLTLRPNLPVVVCSGFSEQDTAHRAMDRGARQFVSKPFQRRELATALRLALEKKKEPPYRSG